MPVVELYLLYCDSQPLPLFDRKTFLATIRKRDPEIILAILALGTRFMSSYTNSEPYMSEISGYAEVARGLVMKRVSEGPVEISTLQCLCLLSLVDFTSECHENVKISSLIITRWQHPQV